MSSAWARLLCQQWTKGWGLPLVKRWGTGLFQTWGWKGLCLEVFPADCVVFFSRHHTFIFVPALFRLLLCLIFLLLIFYYAFFFFTFIYCLDYVALFFTISISRRHKHIVWDLFTDCLIERNRERNRRRPIAVLHRIHNWSSFVLWSVHELLLWLFQTHLNTNLSQDMSTLFCLFLFLLSVTFVLNPCMYFSMCLLLRGPFHMCTLGVCARFTCTCLCMTLWECEQWAVCV